ncbi:MAG: hypothetical protein DRO36_05140, partial [Candidatus Hecatellales archaeon]
VFSPKWTFTSVFLAENLKVNRGDTVLDLGCGVGIQAIFAAEKASQVLALDLNPKAAKCTKLNVRLNRLEDKVEALVGDLFQPLKKEKFDLIVFNPPYLPGKPKNILEKAWIDSEGFLVKRFFGEASAYLKPNGKIQILYSSIAVLNSESFEKLILDNGFKIRLKTKKKLPFETLTIYLVTFKA